MMVSKHKKFTFSVGVFSGAVATALMCTFVLPHKINNVYKIKIYKLKSVRLCVEKSKFQNHLSNISPLLVTKVNFRVKVF